jgi:serine/threonine-protein kinase
VPRGEYWNPRVSPDGQRIAVSDQAQNAIFVFDLRRNIAQRLQGAGLNVGTWSPDSREIVFGWIETGPRNLFRQLADGSQPPQRLTRSPNMQFAGPWSPDGAELLVLERRADSGADIFVLKPDQPDERLRPLLTDGFNEEFPALSPDGRWLAYTSDESGRREVYMRAYPDLQEKQQISNDGGYMPTWSPSGEELFYLRPRLIEDEENLMMAVAITADPSFRAGTPTLLFRGRYQAGSWLRTYDLAPDGRFLMIEPGTLDQEPSVQSLSIVLNWFEELKERVPVP